MNPYEERWRESRKSKMFETLAEMKRGQFKRIFKNVSAEQPSNPELKIPQEEIDRFEFDKERTEQLLKMEPSKPSVKPSHSGTSLSGLDLILMKRRKLEELKRSEETEPAKAATPEHEKLIGAAKIRDQLYKEFVNECFVSTTNPELITPEKVKLLTHWDPVAPIQGTVEMDPETYYDKDLSSEQENVSSGESEREMRRKVADEESEKEIKKPALNKRATRNPEESINVKLKEFYVRDLKEMKSLAYDEELYVYHPNGDIMGSWRVNVKICEHDENFINVQFEGLLARDGIKTTNCMYSAGLVDRTFSPLTELRVEQTTEGDQTSGKSTIFHEKRRRWHFEVWLDKVELFSFHSDSDNGQESIKRFELDYKQMLHVVTESAHILLMRKIVMYRYPMQFDPENHTTICSNGGLASRKRFVLKMRTLCVDGVICRANYRFYAPVKVKFHCQDLDVVRVRRRVEMPGDLVQTSNFYMTTAGQLIAVTFDDPYPYDTPYYLQIDPKAVLDPARVIPPERIVPLRERYMHDPELKSYYEQELNRYLEINRSWLKRHGRFRISLKYLFLELLSDKPHRVIQFARSFLHGLI